MSEEDSVVSSLMAQAQLTILARLRRYPSRLNAVDDRLSLGINQRSRSIETCSESAVLRRRDATDRQRESRQLIERLREVCWVVEAHDSVGTTGD